MHPHGRRTRPAIEGEGERPLRRIFRRHRCSRSLFLPRIGNKKVDLRDSHGCILEAGGQVEDMLAAGAFPVLFRGQENFGPAGSSGGAFIGNWIADGVTELSAFVRHDAAAPLTFFARAASSPAPGAISASLVEVPAGVWTRVTFAITPDSPQWFNFEGSDFATVLSSVARVQFGVFVPAPLAGSTAPVTFDLDGVSIVPAPSSLGLLVLALRRRRR